MAEGVVFPFPSLPLNEGRTYGQPEVVLISLPQVATGLRLRLPGSFRRRHHQTGVDDFLFGSIVTDSACFLILHHISIKICRCGYDRFSFTAPDNLYCKVKYRHDTIPPFCRIRH